MLTLPIWTLITLNWTLLSNLIAYSLIVHFEDWTMCKYLKLQMIYLKSLNTYNSKLNTSVKPHSLFIDCSFWTIFMAMGVPSGDPQNLFELQKQSLRIFKLKCSSNGMCTLLIWPCSRAFKLQTMWRWRNMPLLYIFNNSHLFIYLFLQIII